MFSISNTNTERQLARVIRGMCPDIQEEPETLAMMADEQNGQHPEKPRKMLNEKQVLELIPVARATLYRMEKDHRFPQSFYISPNRRVWFEDEIIAWQNVPGNFDPAKGRGHRRRKS
jgi:prophage regulatory protein